MAPLLPTDGCPSCITPDPVHPYRVEVLETDMRLIAWYRCPSCGWSWTTGWARDALDLPCPGCPACRSDEGQVA